MARAITAITAVRRAVMGELTLNQLSRSFTTMSEIYYSRERLQRRKNPEVTRRDYHRAFGYRSYLLGVDCHEIYRRTGVGRRAVDIFPDLVWSESPVIESNDNNEIDTDFEKAFLMLANEIDLWHYFSRWDKLSRMGYYSALFLGFNDGKDPKEPVVMDPGLKLLYVQPYGEWNIDIELYGVDRQDENYAQPLYYQLTAQTPGQVIRKATSRGRKVQDTQERVHASRVLHLAEGLLENDIVGYPKLMSITDTIADLRKVLGSSAETFWLNGRGILSANAESEGTIENEKEMREQFAKYTDVLERVLMTQGVDVKMLTQAVDSPLDHVTSLLDVTCCGLGVPKRIFIGSERGDLASSQDMEEFHRALKGQTSQYHDSLMLKPFIRKMVNYGVLPRIDLNMVKIKWPSINTQSSAAIAAYAMQISQAIRNYLQVPGAEMLMSPKQYIEDVCKLEYREDEVQEALEREREEMEKQQKMEMELMPPPAPAISKSFPSVTYYNEDGSILSLQSISHLFHAVKIWLMIQPKP